MENSEEPNEIDSEAATQFSYQKDDTAESTQIHKPENGGRYLFKLKFDSRIITSEKIKRIIYAYFK